MIKPGFPKKLTLIQFDALKQFTPEFEERSLEMAAVQYLGGSRGVSACRNHFEQQFLERIERRFRESFDKLWKFARCKQSRRTKQYLEVIFPLFENPVAPEYKKALEEVQVNKMSISDVSNSLCIEVKILEDLIYHYNRVERNAKHACTIFNMLDKEPRIFPL